MKKIIVISGKLRSGKDTLANLMKDEFARQNKTLIHEFFAKRLKEGAINDFKGLQTVVNDMVDDIISLPSLQGNNEAINSLKELKWTDDNYIEIKTPITRALLQIYGTDIFRNRVDINHWVNLVINAINESDEEFFVITDARFENEITQIVDKCNDSKIITIRINRDINRDASANEHPSETGLDNYEDWDYMINNSGTIDDLNLIAKEIVSQIIKM